MVLINVAVYLAMLRSPTDYNELIRIYALTPEHAQWWQYVSSAFMHAGLLHLASNMFFLLVLGDNVEDVIGPLPFLALYLLGGLAGDLLMVAANPVLAIPSLGASGCIAAIAGAYAALFWNSVIEADACIGWIAVRIPVPALLYLLALLGGDVLLTARYGAVLGSGGGVNYVAHGVGFVVGLVAGAWVYNRGAVARYRKLRDGHLLFGYLPAALQSVSREPAKQRRAR
jgi:membrane associated rhomboid family serine protease